MDKGLERKMNMLRWWRNRDKALHFKYVRGPLKALGIEVAVRWRKGNFIGKGFRHEEKVCTHKARKKGIGVHGERTVGTFLPSEGCCAR